MNRETEMNETLKNKFDNLIESLKETRSLAIAFSGGIDSTVLLFAAKKALDNNTLAITIKSPLHPPDETEEASALAKKLGIRHITTETNELEIPDFALSPPERCYLCKSHRFKIINTIANEHGFKTIADGTVQDDLHDFRPGRKAAEEQGIISPLAQAGLSSRDVRKIAQSFNLPNKDKPSESCLAMRFPVGHAISTSFLSRVMLAEAFIKQLGFTTCRVRTHNDIARIEVLPEEMQKLWEQDTQNKINEKLLSLGYRYVAVDIAGYKTGNMNPENLS